MQTIKLVKHQTGFSLLEVMIALVIFSIGLIGLAGLQSASLSYNHSAYLRTQATYLAYDMLDKIRANPDQADDYTTLADDFTDTGTNNACYLSPTGTCSAQQIVQTDIYEWKQAISEILPGGEGKVVEIPVSGINTYEVTMRWNNPSNPSNKTEIKVRSEK